MLVEREFANRRELDAEAARDAGWLSVIWDMDEDGQADYFGVPPGKRTAERVPEREAEARR